MFRDITGKKQVAEYYVYIMYYHYNTLAKQSNIFDFDAHSPACNYLSMSRNERTFIYFKQAVFLQFG